MSDLFDLFGQCVETISSRAISTANICGSFLQWKRQPETEKLTAA